MGGNGFAAMANYPFAVVRAGRCATTVTGPLFLAESLFVRNICLNDRALTAEPAPAPGVDDPGNRFDSDETFAGILVHNAVHERLCG